MATKQKYIDRFWSKVDKRGPDECWNWTAGTISKPGGIRYGQYAENGKMRRAHRFSWQITNGPIPAGLLVLHSCDNGLCVNPKHLRVGTDLDNRWDCITRGRLAPGFNKLNRSQAIEIKVLLAKRMPAVEIAARYDVSPQMIAKIKAGKCWRHAFVP